MSYSFSVRASTKAEVEQKARLEFVTVVNNQPAHKVDTDQAFDAAKQFIRVLRDDPTQDVALTVTGSIVTSDAGVEHAEVNIHAGIVARK